MRYTCHHHCWLTALAILVLTLPSLLCANTKGLQRVEGELFSKQDRVAVVVGVSEYSRYSGFAPLKYADNDARALADFFESQGYFVHLIQNHEAQKNIILEVIAQAGRMLDETGTGTMVFAFSGHGMGQSKENYLATYGSIGKNITKTGLKVADVSDAIAKTGARKRVLFIDACRNKLDSDGKKSGNVVPAFVNDGSSGEMIFYSTQFGGYSYEDDQLVHGAFTHYLLEGLRGEASNEGWVTFEKLSKYVARNVRQWVFKTHKDVQKPYIGGEYSPEDVVVLAKAGTLHLVGEGEQSFESLRKPEQEEKQQGVRGVSRFGSEDKVAVIVGIDHYQHFSPLKYSKKDAEALAEFFQSQGYLVELLTNSEAKPHHILGAIRRASNAGKLIFAYSGHGFSSNGENYLAMSETDFRIKRKALRVSDIRETMKATHAHHSVLFLDAASENISSTRSISGRGLARVEARQNEYILYSTHPDGLDYEDDALKHSVYTNFLLKGLQGEAADVNGVVTFTELSRYVTRKVKMWVYKKYSAIQVPYSMTAKVAGDVCVLARTR